MQAITIPAPAAGRLLGWAIAGVQLVTGGELLGEIEASDGTRYPLLAPTAGEVWRRAERGDLVEVGAPVAGFTPSAPSEALQRPPAPSTASPQPTPTPVPARATAVPSAPRKVPIVEELELESLAPRPTPVPASARTPRPRTKHATYHLTDDQQERLKRLVLELKLEGGELATMSESEALRAAVEMLLALPAPALAATLRENRARERAGKYGVGWPRPMQQEKRR